MSADQFMRPAPPLTRLMFAAVRLVSSVMLPVTPEITAPPFTLSSTVTDPVIAVGADNAVTGVSASMARADVTATALHAALRRRNTLNLNMPLFMSVFSCLDCQYCS